MGLPLFRLVFYEHALESGPDQSVEPRRENDRLGQAATRYMTGLGAGNRGACAPIPETIVGHATSVEVPLKPDGKPHDLAPSAASEATQGDARRPREFLAQRMPTAALEPRIVRRPFGLKLARSTTLAIHGAYACCGSWAMRLSQHRTLSLRRKRRRASDPVRPTHRSPPTRYRRRLIRASLLSRPAEDHPPSRQQGRRCNPRFRQLPVAALRERVSCNGHRTRSTVRPWRQHSRVVRRPATGHGRSARRA